MAYKLYGLAACLASILCACSAPTVETDTDASSEKSKTSAHGYPGADPTWAYSAKTGIGTSYESYLNGAHSEDSVTGPVSKLWFSIAEGVVTETMYGLIHEAQIKDVQLIVTGPDFVDVESQATTSEVDYLYKDAEGRPLSLAYKITNSDMENHYSIEKHIFTDPDRAVLWQRIYFKPNKPGLKLYVQVNPHMDNTGVNDKAWQDEAMYASDKNNAMAMLSSTGLKNKSVGYIGQSDLITDLADGMQDWYYETTGDQVGNVSLAAELAATSKDKPIDLLIGFSDSAETSLALAKASLQNGYSATLKKYNGEGSAVGWQDYLQSLPELNQMAKESGDKGKLLYASALVLKAQEDKTHSGALIASLSNPWGDKVPAVEPSTGYKAVWPRDFYQCAMAFLAMGDKDTAKTAFTYLKKVQVSENTPKNKGDGGWFLQKTHVDGVLEWVAVQLDQTGMPLMLAWKLWQLDVLTDAELAYWYQEMLQPAADFLVDGGQVDIDWNQTEIKPPYTQQERWEEQQGYSPSTTAAVIVGLVASADIAQALGDKTNAKKYLDAADTYKNQLDALTFTTSGHFKEWGSDGRYYLRINATDNPNDNAKLQDRNGKGELEEKNILDAGFLELVRYGIKSPNDPLVIETLPELDSQRLPDEYRVKYLFKDESQSVVYPGWRRYGQDGYGEDITEGLAYNEGGVNRQTQRGRVWPFFTGERGHYQIAAAKSEKDFEKIKALYVKGMEHFANKGLMLPEQVWDGVGSSGEREYKKGQGTNSATPLAWTHAEYVKLLRSLADREVWDRYGVVVERYVEGD